MLPLSSSLARHDYLLSLKSCDLAASESYVRDLLGDLARHAQTDYGKRPHVAMPERRAGNRCRIELPAVCWAPVEAMPADGEKLPASIVDLSLNGCCLSCEAPFTPCQVLCLDFRAPDGRDRRLIVEVARVRRLEQPRVRAYELGCRTVNSSHVQRLRAHVEFRRAVRARLNDHPAIRLVHLCRGSGARRVQQWLAARNYDAARAADANALSRQVAARRAHGVVFPAAALATAKTAWFTALRREHPHVALVAVVASDAEVASLVQRDVHGVVALDDLTAQLGPVLDRALYAGALCRDLARPEHRLKVLVAGPSQRQLRRLETLLLGEDCLVAQSPDPANLRADLASQKFDLAVLTADLLAHEPAKQLKTARNERPQMVVLAEASTGASARLLMRAGADLTLSPAANRSELQNRLAQARVLFEQRTYVG